MELTAFAEGCTSVLRIGRFLCCDASQLPPIDRGSSASDANLDIEQAMYSWDDFAKTDEEMVLSSRTSLKLLVPMLTVSPGQLCCVVGVSGGGKSSLCSV